MCTLGSRNRLDCDHHTEVAGIAACSREIKINNECDNKLKVPQNEKIW